MNARMKGSLRIGRLLGVDVFVHWSWALVAFIEIQTRHNAYSTQAWNVAEYLALFLVVFLHEMGHALACRSVGGRADTILLWPLGGVAYVQPPPRPGALLWSIIAGPLVNLALLAVLTPAVIFSGVLHLPPDPHHFVVALWAINLVLFCFNMLPVYPLDGGQFAQALLWFLIGRARSLQVVSVIGIAAGAIGAVVALARGSLWYMAMAAFVVMRAFGGMRQARVLAQTAAAPRRAGFACPHCRAAPPVGPFWVCPCKTRFDAFETGGVCPGCSRAFPATSCVDCNKLSPLDAFRRDAPRMPEGALPGSC
jgi:Zn-dependent protease